MFGTENSAPTHPYFPVAAHDVPPGTKLPRAAGEAAPLKLPPKYTALYQKLNLKITEETRPVFYSNNLMEPPKQVSSGAADTVYAVQLKTTDGALQDFFKPLQAKDFDAIPHARIAILDVGQGPQLGLVMEHPTAQTSPPRNPSQPRTATPPESAQTHPTTPQEAAPYAPVAAHDVPPGTKRPRAAGEAPPLKLPPKYTALYQKLNLKITEETRPVFYSNNLMEPPKKVSSGEADTVYAVQLKTTDGALPGFFKPLQAKDFDAIPHARVAILDVGQGPQLGLVMEHPTAQTSLQRNPSQPRTGHTAMPRESAQPHPATAQTASSNTAQTPPQRGASLPPATQASTPQEGGQATQATSGTVNEPPPQTQRRAQQATASDAPLAANHEQPDAKLSTPPKEPPLQPQELAAKHAELYKKINLKVTEETLPAFSNADLAAPPKKLGSGEFNTVYAVKLNTANGTLDGVFKPLRPTEYCELVNELGITENDPQFAIRNLATLAYARKLGFDVIPDTRLAVIDVDQGEGPQLGLVMDRAPGMPAEAALQLSPKVMSGELIAEVIKLQLLDHLTGQVDRHRNNYFLATSKQGKAKATGIDNDLCFSPEIKNLGEIQDWNGTALPHVIDTEMAAKINALEEPDLREMLEDKLSQKEVRAAIIRLRSVKRHIADLQKSDCVIEPNEWNQPHIQSLLGFQNDEMGNYAGREQIYGFAFQKFKHRDVLAHGRAGSLGVRLSSPQPEKNQESFPKVRGENPAGDLAAPPEQLIKVAKASAITKATQAG